MKHGSPGSSKLGFSLDFAAALGRVLEMAVRAALLVFGLGFSDDNTVCEIYSCYDTRGHSSIHVMIWVDAVVFAATLFGDRLCLMTWLEILQPFRATPHGPSVETHGVAFLEQLPGALAHYVQTLVRFAFSLAQPASPFFVGLEHVH